MNIHLTWLDWTIIIAFFSLTIILGLIVAKKSGKNEEEYFLGGRNMPWWLLGFSMVATTFSTDTPNLVTNLVRLNGVFGNWVWWSMLPTGMLTVFLYAKLWRRSGTVTDLEFYEMRYSGKLAAFLRGFRAVYLGLLFNVLVMASVSLAAIKIGGAMMGLSPYQSVCFAMVATVIFSAVGGLRGVLLTDFVLFIVSMVGAIGAAYFAVNLPEVGGLSAMIDKLQAVPELASRMEVYDYLNRGDLIACFIVPFAVTWWSIWYPGAEPGGGGYLVQRMLAAKNENHAVGATLFFNVAHYALRPWPWLLVALASLVVYPNLASIGTALNGVLPDSQIKDDVAYSLMLTKLPAGWIGLVLTSLLAAYMSTISTHLNWGSSYLVNDVWKRFCRPNAKPGELVWMGRLFTVVLMVIAGLLALQLQSAVDTFKIMLSIGAGTGLLFMLRWFWWRINAAAELTAMIASFLLAVGIPWAMPHLQEMGLLDSLWTDWEIMIISVAATTVCWLAACYFGPRTSDDKLRKFVARINPGGPGWKTVLAKAKADGHPIVFSHPSQHIGQGILAAVVSCFAVYFALIATGEFIYKRNLSGTLFAAGALAAGVAVVALWRRMNRNSDIAV
ncbi:MAG: sodium:solute symporter family protein [Victivallaceae bacterium]|nr:sodium:solute symporter family protein [Victivallaceae bacterium]